MRPARNESGKPLLSNFGLKSSTEPKLTPDSRLRIIPAWCLAADLSQNRLGLAWDRAGQQVAQHHFGLLAAIQSADAFNPGRLANLPAVGFRRAVGVYAG